MGLFSFLKNAGPKIFGSNKGETPKTAPATSETDRLDAANKLRATALTGLVQSLNINIQNLEIVVSDDVATVYGEAGSQGDREKAILAIGNVDGIATVDDRLSVTAPDPEPEAQFYEVKKGDTLSKIAKEFYGSANKYPVIFEANKPMLKDPNLIYPGQVLRIPPIA